MKVSRTRPKKRASPLKARSTKKKLVRKSAKTATKKSAFAAYVRDHKKAYRTLAAIDENTLKSVRSIVANVLAKRGV
jgi:hypothetical protein